MSNRKEVIEDAKLAELLTKKEEQIKQGRQLTEEIEKLERERAKIGLQIQKTKDKVIPLVQKLAKPLLTDQYDDLEKVDLVDGKIEITIFNHLEEWKKHFEEARKK